PENEIGNGDPVTGTKGRIMWFPPYDLKFSETTSVNLDTHAFIGRGEPMYTYNNTERSGNLSFKVIIDHAGWMNDMRGAVNNDEKFASINAGCWDYESLGHSNFSADEKAVQDIENAA